MKILHVATSDGGGAGRAAYRLHQGLLKLGHNSQMVVRKRVNDDESVIPWQPMYAKISSAIGRRLERVAARALEVEEAPWWFGLMPGFLPGEIHRLKPDIVHLHWVCDGFLGVAEIASIQSPLVWSFHDLAPLTEGYAYLDSMLPAWYEDGSPKKVDGRSCSSLGRWNANRKSRSWSKKGIHVVAPSRWMAEAAAESELFKDKEISHIPYGLDTQVFSPADQRVVRDKLGLPLDKHLLLFGAANADGDPRKGGDLLNEALACLRPADMKKEVEVVIFGGSLYGPEKIHGLSCHHLGNLAEDGDLANVYAACDVFIAPSREDNLPNTVLEALSCGTPVAAFAIGGMPDMVIPGKTGYLAKPFDTKSMAAGITQILQGSEGMLRNTARTHAFHHYDLLIQARRMEALYSKQIHHL